MDNALPKIQSMIDQHTELEDFLTTVDETYHGSGHLAVAKGKYRKAYTN